MSVSVIYFTEAFEHKTNDFPGKHSEPFLFTSLKEAMDNPFPAGCVSAIIQDDETGCHTYSKQFGWNPLGKP